MKTPRLRRLLALAAALLFLCLLPPALTRAEGVTVKGIVYYSTMPLSGVLVELRSNSSSDWLFESTRSDASGSYAFNAVPAGTYCLRAYGPSAEYVEWLAYEVTVGTDNVVQDLYLEKDITLLEPAQGSVISTPSPRYCWVGLAEAATYSLQVNRRSDWAVAESRHGITDTCYASTAILEDGVQYTWRVEAADSARLRIGRTIDAFTFTVQTVGARVSGAVYYASTPLAGVVVELRQDSSSGPLIASTTTGAAGAYDFTAVPAGMFYLIPLRPSGEYASGVSYPIVVTDSDVTKDLYLPKIITLLEPPQCCVVSTSDPRFCWTSLPEAATHELYLHRWPDLALVSFERGITGTCATLAAALESGVEYGWLVKALDPAGHTVGFPSVWFRFTYTPEERLTYLPLALR